jgi:PAS domain S-box-containing protein
LSFLVSQVPEKDFPMTKQSTNEEPGRQAQELENDTLKSRMWQENRGKSRTAAEQSIDGIMTSDMEKNISYVNQAYAAIEGYSAEKMIRMKTEDLHDLRTEKNMGKNNVTSDQVVTQGSWLGELERIRKDGIPFPTYHFVTLLKDNDRRSKGAVTVHEDSTEHKRAEKEIGKLTSAIENAIDGIAICNPEGRFIYVNRVYAEMHGYVPNEMIGMHVVDLHKEEERLSELEEKLENNKLICTAKGILMDRYNISEKESFERLQKESRNQRKKMKEIAQAIISSRSILD